MKIIIVGSRGIPASYGGFETFAEELSNCLVKKGYGITVINEKINIPKKTYSGITIINSEYNKSENPLRYYFKSLKVASENYDIIICCGVGGAVFYPFINFRNAKIITCVDGLEHLRKKYSWFKRLFVRLAQRFAAIYSNILIADSLEVSRYWMGKFKKQKDKIEVIEYGANPPLTVNTDHLKAFSLKADGFYLVVARFVPENNIDLILDSFQSYNGNKKLVLVGGFANDDFLQNRKNQNENIVFTGPIYDKAVLDCLRQSCSAYIHGHSVGGTNPSLLESMAAENICICFDSPFNREVTAGAQLYFKTADDLSGIVRRLEAGEFDKYELKRNASDRINSYYNWDRIVNLYDELFIRLEGGK
jgi:glycosyltransferase involved in cell wall biosynthesis